MSIPQSKKILVVDDSEFDRTLLVRALGKLGKYQILEAKNGGDCLRIVESGGLDLVLLDVMMPDTTGLELLPQIRKRFNEVELPVIMITAKSETDDVVSALKLGANDYISKPVNFEVAISRVEMHFRYSDTSKRMASLKELETAHALVTTYCHEVNNPLAIALGYLQSPKWGADPVIQDNFEASLWRIADIIKKLREATETKIEFRPTTEKSGKMVKINK